MRRRIASLLPLAATLFVPVAGARAGELQPGDVARLILNERGGVPDAVGWGEDVLNALADNKLPVTRENVCAVVAVVSQESAFNANPTVPGLGRIAERAVREKLAAIPLLGGKAFDYLDTIPTPRNSFVKRIRAAKTERDLDLAYRALVEHAARSSSLDGLLRLGLFDKTVEEYNQVSTVGSMQVSVAFAQETERGERWRPMTHAESNEVRDRLYSRRGGLYYGTRQLLDYKTGYAQKIFRFADYNAGRFAARNAAFQGVVARLSGVKLATDGDLLAYNKAREPTGEITRTEKALRTAIARHSLDIDDAALRRDLLREKQFDFMQTRTFRAVRAAYQRATHAAPPFAALPGIQLKSAKIKSRMTTGSFAQSVNRRYGKCMSLALTMDQKPVLKAPSFWPDW